MTKKPYFLGPFRLPRKKDVQYIKIGGYIYTLVDGDLSNDAYGEHREVELEIVLRRGISPQHKFNTLIHEVFHSLNDMYSLGLKEKTIQALGSGWAQVLIDNNVYELAHCVE